MREKISSTELARRFGDVLAAVKHGGESVVVTKNGEPVAELGPVSGAVRCSLREFVDRWSAKDTDPDDAFADDLAAVNASDQPAANPWES